MRLISNFGFSMIDACHIIPFKVSGDDRVTNGIALCPNLHRAFDRGLISVGDDFKILVSTHFAEDKASPTASNSWQANLSLYHLATSISLGKPTSDGIEKMFSKVNTARRNATFARPPSRHRILCHSPHILGLEPKHDVRFGHTFFFQNPDDVKIGAVFLQPDFADFIYAANSRICSIILFLVSLLELEIHDVALLPANWMCLLNCAVS